METYLAKLTEFFLGAKPPSKKPFVIDSMKELVPECESVVTRHTIQRTVRVWSDHSRWLLSLALCTSPANQCLLHRHPTHMTELPSFLP